VLEHVRQAAARYGVPERLVTAVIRAESGFNPRAVSPKGARGLMQLMPQTASLLGVHDSFDPAQNIDGGVRHLRGLIDRFANNLPLALAAYNAGENAVTQYGGIPPYAETQGYVTKVLSFFEPGTGGAGSPRQAPTVRYTDLEGTTIYTNVPPPASVRLRR
jgi:soluble lytic murein transglycosylase-like protein